MLLNDIWPPNQKSPCKLALKLHQKQFNILNCEYSKFLIYNNPSFEAAKSAEVCLNITFVKINSAIYLFVAIICQKLTLATVNSLKVVEIVLSEIWKLYRALHPSPTLEWLVQYNICFVLTQFKWMFLLCRNLLVCFHSDYPP